MAWTRTKAVVATCAIAIIIACVAVVVANMRSSPAPAQKRKLMDVSQLMKTPGYAVTTEAVSFLHQLKINGELPGVAKNEQIMLLFPPGIANATNYPIIRNFQGRKKNGGPWPYHFIVIKTSATNDWQLQKAWRTGTNGNVVEKFSVPGS